MELIDLRKLIVDTFVNFHLQKMSYKKSQIYLMPKPHRYIADNQKNVNIYSMKY